MPSPAIHNNLHVVSTTAATATIEIRATKELSNVVKLDEASDDTDAWLDSGDRKDDITFTTTTTPKCCITETTKDVYSIVWTDVKDVTMGATFVDTKATTFKSIYNGTRYNDVDKLGEEDTDKLEYAAESFISGLHAHVYDEVYDHQMVDSGDVSKKIDCGNIGITHSIDGSSHIYTHTDPVTECQTSLRDLSEDILKQLITTAHAKSSTDSIEQCADTDITIKYRIDYKNEIYTTTHKSQIHMKGCKLTVEPYDESAAAAAAAAAAV